MKFTINREDLIIPLKRIIIPISSSSNLPILDNLLLQVKNNSLILTSTNLEVEITTFIFLNKIYERGSITVSIRKFYDICYKFNEKSEITISLNNTMVLINSKSSKYYLSTMPSISFPKIKLTKIKNEFLFSKNILTNSIDNVKFSIAINDIRHYLNGMLLEINNNKFYAVSTDGHRLAIAISNIDYNIDNFSIIVPRKSIIELFKLLNSNTNNFLNIKISFNNYLYISVNNYIFISKLIDNHFPNYNLVIPKNFNSTLLINRIFLKQSLMRLFVLTYENFYGVKFILSKNLLKLIIRNNRKEQAEEILNINYSGEYIEIGVNIKYILDILNILKNNIVEMSFNDNKSSIKITDYNDKSKIYIIMPMII